MNLFYAIIVSTLSDAKIEEAHHAFQIGAVVKHMLGLLLPSMEDAKQKKKWAVLSDRQVSDGGITFVLGDFQS